MTMKLTPPRRPARLLIGAFAALAICSGPAAAAELDRIPAKTPEEAAQVFEAILAEGPSGIKDLTRKLVVPGEQDDSTVRIALHGLALYVSRAGADAQRSVFAKALAAQLDSKLPDDVKGFLIRQLQHAGGPEATAALGNSLTNTTLSEYAAQALLATNDKAVAEQFKKALPKATGACRLTVIQALGNLQAARGSAAVTAALRSNDINLRLTAASALANSADPAAADAILRAIDTGKLYEHSKMIDAALLLARRLGEAGNKAQAERICRHVMKTQAGPENVHVQCAALLSLATALGADAMDDVLKAMGSDDPDIRATGIAAAIAMPGEDATQRWVQRMKSAPAGQRIGILDLIARRGDPAALPAVLEMVSHADEKVRVAAIKAAGQVGNAQAVLPLSKPLANGSAIEKTAARNALLHIPGKAVSAAIAAALPGVTPDMRAGLLDMLAARGARECIADVMKYTGDADANVSAAAVSALGRLAGPEHLAALADLLIGAKQGKLRKAAESALQGACRSIGDKDRCVEGLSGKLAGAKGPARAALLRVLGDIGNRKACDLVRSGLKDADPDARDAAIRALADWRDDSPTDELLAIAKTADSKTHRVLALRGYVRMIGLRKNRPNDEQLAMCKQAMDLAKDADAKRRVLSAIGGIPDGRALEMALPLLSTPDMKVEAAVAVIKIARAISGGDADGARAAIAKAKTATSNAEVQKQAAAAIDYIERFEGYITVWKIAGPYRGGDLFKKQFPPEQNAKDVKWRVVSATDREPAIVDFNRLLGQTDNCAGYMKCQIWSPNDQKARLDTGSDDGLKVWLNGKVVYEKDAPRSLNVGEDKIAVQLSKGWNELLMKVTQGGGGWEACARLRSADGAKLPGVRLKAE